MRSKVIYYKGDKEGINGKGRDKGKDSKSEVQLFIYISDASFINNFINRKSL
jgi:hypothetical protein